MRTAVSMVDEHQESRFSWIDRKVAGTSVKHLRQQAFLLNITFFVSLPGHLSTLPNPQDLFES
jgi:hypothetical protein